MSTSGPNHYEVLNVGRLASKSEIYEAYRAILLVSHPDNMEDVASFTKSLADWIARAANAAWEVLSDPVRKKEYYAGLPFLDSLIDPWRPVGNAPWLGAPSPKRKFPSSSGYGFSYGEEEETDGEEADNEAVPQEKSRDPKDVPGAKAAEFRYGSTSTTTDIDLQISNWRLYLLLSSKYHFKN
jgi:curved DNA-binding protein CbpA